MTLAHMIANAPGGAERLRQLAGVPFTPYAERVALIEQAVSFEGLAKFARQHLRPEPSEVMARARAESLGHGADLVAAGLAAMARPKGDKC